MTMAMVFPSPLLFDVTAHVALWLLVQHGHAKRLLFLTGAGVSVGAGIPDFRSPGGMYDTLRPELLTASAEERVLMQMDPTAVVSRTIFDNNPLPYLELRRPFILGLADGQWRATIAHHFIALCQEHGLLLRLFTQNIDGLDFQTCLPEEKIVSVHGTMGRAECEFCLAPYPIDDFREEVRRNIKDIYQTDADAPLESSPVLCKACGLAGIKPATVLYGGTLPQRFFECVAQDAPDADLLFVCGTSLAVGPANTLPSMVNAPRILVNRDDVRHAMGEPRPDDMWLPGDCDTLMLDLIEELGWLDELKKRKHLLPPHSQREPRLQ